jgi:hypothetical protein
VTYIYVVCKLQKNSVSLVGEIATENKREQGEWKTKAKELGFEF